MYTDEDLNLAVKEGIFSTESVERFRATWSEQRQSPAVDEEKFKLVSGFNDIFVVMSSMLLLFSASYLLYSITDSESAGFLVLTVLSWFLTEFFVRRRKMLLPAVVLTVSFISGLFLFGIFFFDDLFKFPDQDYSFAISALLTTIAGYCHWLRFRVPITVAAGTGAAVILIVSIYATIFPNYGAVETLMETMETFIVFVCGLLTFCLAMYWDSRDTSRTTRHADTAFWLHLLAAPLIIHPVFSSFGVFDGNENIGSMAVVIVLYILMTLISLIIDRRSFMVSSLIYVLYAINTIFETYDVVGYGFSFTGVFMGGMLLLLSAFWHQARTPLVNNLSSGVRHYIPAIQTTL